MKERRLAIEISLRSPLVIGVDRERAQYNQTRDYVPGSALRGALAGTMLNGGEPTEAFEVLFGDPTAQPLFTNLYPSQSGLPTYPLPLSARTCKYHGGFQTGDDGNHGVGDILIRQAVFEALLDAGASLPFLYEPRCPQCHSEVKALTGYYEVGPHYGRTTAPIRRMSRTAIDRRRGTAAEEMLYTLEAIEPGRRGHPPMLFLGDVLCDKTQEALLKRWLPRVRGIGGGRSRGLGQVEVTVLEDEERPLPPLKDRLEAFDAAVRREWQFYQRVADVESLPDDVRFFALDLTAPAFLTRHGIPASRPRPADLGLPAGAIRLWRAISRQTMVGGWHMGGQLPRRTMLATTMGSVFMYRTEGLSLDDLAVALKLLEREGLGEERARGFGRIVVSSPIHYQPEVTL